MKRLFVIALTLVFTHALCLNYAFGQTQEEIEMAKPVYNETTGKGYDDLEKALEAAKNEKGPDVLIVNQDVKMTGRRSLPSLEITIRGKNSDIVITAADNKKGQYFFNVSSDTNNGNIVFENLILDGNSEGGRVFQNGSGTINYNPIDARGSNYFLIFKNVIIRNFNISSDLNAVISVTDNSNLSLENVSFQNIINNSAKKAYVYYKNTRATNKISGTIKGSFYVDFVDQNNVVTLICEGLNPDSKIDIYGKLNIPDYTYFTKTTLKEVFTMKDEGLALALNDAGDGLKVVKKSELPKPTAIGIEGSEETYETLAEAIEAAPADAKIIVNEPQEISAPINIERGLTIAGKEDAASTDKIPLDIKGDGKIAVTASVTLSNLKIGRIEEGNEPGSSGEPGSSSANASDITVSGEGVVLTLDDIYFTSGIAITLAEKGQLKISNGLTVPDGEVIALNIGNHAEGDVLVSGCAEEDLAKFKLNLDSEEYLLKFDSDNGNIILAKKQVEPDPEPDPKPTAISIEGSEETFDTLTEAIAAAQAGAKIVVNESQEISAPINIEKGLTIAGKRSYAGGVVGTGSTGGSGSWNATEKPALKFLSGGSTGGSIENGSLKVTASATLSNLKLRKSEQADASSANASHITVSGEGVVLTLDGIDFISGITITLAEKGQLKIANGLTVPDGEVIALNIGNHVEGDVLVSGCIEEDLAKFKLNSDSEEIFLKFDNGNIILARKQVEPDPDPDPKPTKISILNKKGYDTFEAALEAAVEGDEIIINEPVEILEPVVLNKALTIRGKENLSDSAEPEGEVPANVPSLKIRAAYFSFNIGAAVTIKNITLDGAGFTGSGLIKISGQNANLKLSDVKIQNYSVSEDETAALILAGDNGKIALSGLVTENITLPDGKATLRLSGAGSSIGGLNDLSIQLVEKTLVVKSSELTNTEKITVYPGSHADGDVLVSGCAEADLEKFNFVIHDEFEVKFKEGNIVLAKKVKEPVPGPDPKPTAVSIEGREETFDTLTEAIAAAEGGARIIMNEPQEVDAPLNIEKELTIAGKADASSTDKMALNLSEKGMIAITASATLSNLKITQTAGETSGSGEPASLPSAISLSGASVCLTLDDIDLVNAMTITLSNKGYLKLSGVLNVAESITLDVREAVEGAILVSGCAEEDFAKFRLNSEDYLLEFKEGNIVLAKKKQEPGEPEPDPKPTAVAIEGTDLTFDTLAEALAVAEAGNTIIIKENLTISETLVVDKSVTISGGKDGGTAIDCIVAPAFRISADATVENLVLDGKGTSGGCLIDFGEGSFELSLADITIHDYTFGADDRKLVDVPRSCKLHVRNVNVEKINGPANKGMINICGEGSTLDGSSNVSLHLNGSHTVSVKGGAALTHTTPIRIYITSHRHGSPVVINCTDPKLFAISGYELKAEGGNLVLVDLKSGIDGITSDSGEAEYFTLDGVKVAKDRLEPGVYIRKLGNRTYKIRITR